MQHEDLIELLNIGSDVVVREDDAFGIASRAAGKNNRCDIVERRVVLAACDFHYGFDWQETCGERRKETLTQAGIFYQVFEKNGFRGWLHLHPLKEGARGDDRFEVALFRARCQRRVRSRVIQINRHFSHEHSREIHQRARNRRRHQDADHFLPLPVLAQAPRQKNRARQHGEVVQLGRLPVGHGEAKRIPARRIDK